jgi:hypothetical protein
VLSVLAPRKPDLPGGHGGPSAGARRGGSHE